MYDLIIIGGGPAGLTAGIYAGRYKLETLIISKIFGGAALEAHMIENWPGEMFIRGPDLINKIVEQVKNLGVEIKEAEVSEITKNKDSFKVYADEQGFEAKKLVLALGTQRRRLDLPNEEKYLGKGISYCVHCDAPVFKDKVVGVVGGRNSAAMAALLLAEYAKKVYISYRRDKMRCDPLLLERIEKNNKIEIIYNSNVIELRGNEVLEGVKLDNGKELQIEGLFIEIGATPSVVIAKELGVMIDEQGYIIVDGNMRTNIDGIYAAGDITTANAKFKQLTTAVGEGSVAAFSAYKSLKWE